MASVRGLSPGRQERSPGKELPPLSARPGNLLPAAGPLSEVHTPTGADVALDFADDPGRALWYGRCQWAGMRRRSAEANLLSMGGPSSESARRGRAPLSFPGSPRGVALLLSTLALGCAAESPPDEDLRGAPAGEPEEEVVSEASSALNASLPEAPALARDVAMIAAGNYTHPTTPAFRTSADGRVSINLKGGPTSFRLIKPEMLTGPFATQPAGTPMVQAQSKTLADGLVHAHSASLGGGVVSHRTLCDGTSQLPKAGAKTNPYACGVGGASDCYDLTIVATYPFTAVADSKPRVELWGTPVTVRVDNPKTAAAAIGAVTAGAPVLGPTWVVGHFFEPMVTADGHLLVGRVERASVTWPKADATPVTGKYDIVYSVAGAADAPCDVTKWSQLYPVSHAAYHPGLSARYGFAHYPLRDPENNPIADGVDVKATYPWIDRKGNNLFFMTVSSTLYYTDPQGAVKSRYPASCVSGVTCSFPATGADIGMYDEASNTRGASVAGLWTHGKMVLLDNLINNVDYGLRIADDRQRMLSLYQPNGDETGLVRAGSGRDTSASGVPSPSTTNTTFVDSLENLFEHAPNARALAVRDVVWTVNSGRGSDEVVFDDYLDPDALVFSEMSGSLSFSGGFSATDFAYHDGFKRTSGLGGAGFSDLEEVRVQNAATAVSERWAIPAYGKVTGGARLEPVALGGIRGKGLWLDGDDSVEYTFPAQPRDINAVPLFVSLFLDSRFLDDDVARRLFTFPDGSAIEVIGRARLRFVRTDGAVQVTYVMPAAAPLASKTFTHLAFGIAAGGGQVRVYLDGLHYRTWSSASVKLFRFVPGTFRVGAAPGKDGVKGWIDEVKVLASAPDPEVACNHARGTLIGFSSLYAGYWKGISNRYPAAVHAEISTLLAGAGEATFDKYACFHAYADEHGAHLGNIPSGTTSVRRGLLFPESPLVWNQPRPDSASNPFCLGCHVAGQRASLTPAALTLDPTKTTADDPRRQPLQPPRLVFGNVPAGYVPGTGLPAASTTAPVTGLKLDAWVFP